MGLPGLGRLPVGDLDQDIGVIEHPVPGAAQEPVLTRSLRRDQALENTLSSSRRPGLACSSTITVIATRSPLSSLIRACDTRLHPPAVRPCESSRCGLT